MYKDTLIFLYLYVKKRAFQEWPRRGVLIDCNSEKSGPGEQRETRAEKREVVASIAIERESFYTSFINEKFLLNFNSMNETKILNDEEIFLSHREIYQNNFFQRSRSSNKKNYNNFKNMSRLSFSVIE